GLGAGAVDGRWLPAERRPLAGLPPPCRPDLPAADGPTGGRVKPVQCPHPRRSQRTLPSFQALSSCSYGMVSPLGFSLSSFFQGAPLSLSHLEGSLRALSLGGQLVIPTRCSRAMIWSISSARVSIAFCGV